MSDENPLIANLDADGTGTAAYRRKVLEGDAAASKNAAASLVAKDDSGNLIYLRTNSSGELIVAPAGSTAGNCKGGHLTKTAGSTSRTQVGSDVALVAGKDLTDLEWSFSNYRSTVYEVVIVDDPGGTPVETPILDVICSESDNSESGKQECMQDIITTGMTGPVMRVYGTNLNKASDFRGRVTVKEAA